MNHTLVNLYSFARCLSFSPRPSRTPSSRIFPSLSRSPATSRLSSLPHLPLFRVSARFFLPSPSFLSCSYTTSVCLLFPLSLPLWSPLQLRLRYSAEPRGYDPATPPHSNNSLGKSLQLTVRAIMLTFLHGPEIAGFRRKRSLGFLSCSLKTAFFTIVRET